MQHTRTIFGNYEDLLFTTRKWNIPRKEDVARARIVCLDPPFHEESTLVSRFSRECGIPYVTIDCPFGEELADNAAALVISGEFRERAYPGVNLEELFHEYHRRSSGWVIFTVGGDDLLYARKDEPVRHFTPYPVQVIDSAGAGDSFRAGIVFGILNGWSDLETVRYSSALAAMICTRFPGVLNCPTHPEVLAFMREREA